MKLIITNLERTLPNDVITKVQWKVIETVDNITVEEPGFVFLLNKDPSDPSFVPFDQVTKEQVELWTMEAIGESVMSDLEYILNAKINDQKTPKKADGLPWKEL